MTTILVFLSVIAAAILASIAAHLPLGAAICLVLIGICFTAVWLAGPIVEDL